MVDFLVIGPLNASKYNCVFELMMDKSISYGYKYDRGHMFFYIDKDDKENSIIDVARICWYTCLNCEQKRHIDLTRVYNEEEYDKFDGTDILNIDDIRDIPVDYYGLMGVPTTFFCKWNQDEFEIIGKADTGNYKKDLFKPMVDGKAKYVRLLIRRRK